MAPDTLPAGRFRIVCHYCNRQMLARDAWIGRSVECPYCNRALSVPKRPKGDQPVLAKSAKYATARRFNFPCPRCQSLLETSTGVSGQEGRCPTCNARFIVPHLGAHAQQPDRAKLLDDPTDSPQPLHAYGASGDEAPQIHRLPDGSIEIECPRCGARNDIAVDSCGECGAPFTMEGVTKVALPQGGLAVLALIVALVSIPLAMFIVPGVIAILLAALAWLRRGGIYPPILGVIAAVIGGASAVLGLLGMI